MLTVEYVGTRYLGWQRQPDVPTVQGTLEAALTRVLGTPIAIVGASRTDRGVHALGHVSHFVSDSTIPLLRLRQALNDLLPTDIAVRELALAPPGFHARYSATGKHYRYSFHAGAVRVPHLAPVTYRVSHPLVAAWMHEAGAVFVGTHDFFSLASRSAKREDTRRTLFALTVRRRRADPAIVDLDLVGDGFLYNMVRTIAGMLALVGRGRRTRADCEAALSVRDRALAGPNLPPEGLTLVRVYYEPLPEALAPSWPAASV